MNLSKGEGMDTCHSPRRVKVCDKEKDFLSELPDAILLHILSFLPIGDAIKTVLLRRFGNLWRHTSVLDLNDCLHHICGTYDYENKGAYHNQKFVDLIGHVLAHLEGKMLDKLLLKFCFEFHYAVNYPDDSDTEDYLEREKSTGEEIDKLICYALSRHVKVLDLNLMGCSSVDRLAHYILPDTFRSNYLSEMRLVACGFKLCTEMNLKALGVLFLDQVSLTDEIMERILLGCPSLEDLSLVGCFGLTKLILSNPNLKSLMLTLDKGRPLMISCPFVLSLKIYGCIESAQLLNISSTVNPSIFFSSSFHFEQRSYDDVKGLLQKLSECETLTPCTWTIMESNSSN